MTPTWALTLAYWAHMLATILWIGGLAIFFLFVSPAAQGALDAETQLALREKYQKRLRPLAWFSVVVLLGSGMLQMSANPNYGGFLAIDNLWSAAILIKHLLFLGMVLNSGYLTWGVIPALQRAALRQSHGKNAPELQKLQRRETRLLQLNLVLGILVLALTALARAS